MNTIRAKALSIILMSCLLPTRPREAGAQITLTQQKHESCIDLLASTEQVYDSGFQLGRVFRGGEIVEPVLIQRKEKETGTEYSFRDCSSGEPIESPLGQTDLSIFDSALVARFFQEISARTKDHTASQGSFDPQGAAKVSFRDTGNILEARRLGENHFEITKASSVGDGVAVLLVATRKAMSSMELEDWESGWGDRPTDPHIKREIVWWELTRGRRIGIHPVVESFADLAHRVRGNSPADPEIGWERALEENLDTFLNRGAISLIVASRPWHHDLVKAMRKKASEAGSEVVIDAARLKKRRRRVQGSDEETGKSWALVRFSGLVAVMPKRITGKIRNAYRQPFSGMAGTKFTNAIIATDFRTVEVANAIFQDQIASLVSRLNFLECVLENAQPEKDRVKLLKEGLKRMRVSLDGLEDMYVDTVFQHLLQGFNLPPSLRCGKHNFLTSISRRNPELLSLVQLLKAHLYNTSLGPIDPCMVVLIPDTILHSQPVLAPSIPVAGSGSLREISVPQGTDSEEALSAKEAARRAQANAIYAEAARHSRPEMLRGYRAFERGYYTQAEKIFTEATERAEKSKNRRWSLPFSNFTLGLKSWNASLSADGINGDTAFFPGVYCAWDLGDRIWMSAGYVAGDADFIFDDLTTSGSIEEIDADLIIGWSYAKLDIGIGYRLAEFTTSVRDSAVTTSSGGPVVYLGGGDAFGQYRSGYYWGAAYLFEDIADEDGAQKHFNGELGVRWTSRKDLSILLGYRYREYFGDGINIKFDGPVVNIAFTWR